MLNVYQLWLIAIRKEMKMNNTAIKYIHIGTALVFAAAMFAFAGYENSHWITSVIIALYMLPFTLLEKLKADNIKCNS